MPLPVAKSGQQKSDTSDHCTHHPRSSTFTWNMRGPLGQYEATNSSKWREQHIKTLLIEKKKTLENYKMRKTKMTCQPLKKAVMTEEEMVPHVFRIVFV